ncbi:hypothetical protein ECG_02039 [Echinococcus granulosus]|nr:hypothetical protein ECG_02038 [Echinococcus granulosus]KAH9286016.1 hypothetical protein ECG_02039 [Echinococcus granulosus]
MDSESVGLLYKSTSIVSLQVSKLLLTGRLSANADAPSWPQSPQHSPFRLIGPDAEAKNVAGLDEAVTVGIQMLIDLFFCFPQSISQAHATVALLLAD